MVFLVNGARVIFAPLLGEFIADFGIGEGTAGFIATLVWLGSAAPRLPAGWLLTRVPRHYVVLATGTALSATAAFTALSHSVLLLMVGALGMGLSSGFYFVAANPLLSELYPSRVGWAMGVHGTAGQIAAVVAAPFVTAIIFLFADWRVVFTSIAVLTAVVTILLYVVAQQTSLPTAGAADTDLLRGLRAEWRRILLGITLIGAAGFVWQGLFNFYELYMMTKGLEAATAKNMLTVIFATGVPAFFISGYLADRLPRIPYILTLITIFAGCVVVLTLITQFWILCVLTAAIGFVIHSLFPAIDTFVLDGVADASRSSAYAGYSGGMMLVQASGSSVVGGLLEYGLGYEIIFSALAVSLLVVVGIVTGRRSLCGPVQTPN